MNFVKLFTLLPVLLTALQSQVQPGSQAATLINLALTLLGVSPKILMVPGHPGAAHAAAIAHIAAALPPEPWTPEALVEFARQHPNL